jgi:hypothetical protein
MKLARWGGKGVERSSGHRQNITGTAQTEAQ